MQFRKGNKVPFPDKIADSYAYSASNYRANVDADKLKELLRRFILMQEEELFFILEMPTSRQDELKLGNGKIEKLHKDIYGVGYCTVERSLKLLDMLAELLINDGMCAFGFGCHESHDEIMVGKYNVVWLYARSGKTYDSLFDQLEIPKVDELVTAWDTFTHDDPGESMSVETGGKRVYDIPEMLRDWEICLLDRVED